MAFESFYGGRQGVSFVIVEHYDSVEDMLAVFAQGGATTHEVNYGEYVIIDTPDKNDRTNGTVYRRGMRFDADGIARPLDPLAQDYLEKLRLFLEDPGKGAEYIGQIIGPQGAIKELEVGDYNPNPSGNENVHGGIGEYTPVKVVPGNTNNGIKYSWENFLDATTGEIQKYLIGFEFPYYVQEWITERGTAYPPVGTSLITDITPIDAEHPDEYDVDQSHRPWYRKYKLTVPKGVKGDSVTNTSAIPVGVRAGSSLYTTPNFSPEGAQPIGDTDRIFNQNQIKNYRKTDTYICFEIDGTNQYARPQDCIAQHSGLYITNYDGSEQGEGSQNDGGLFNYIEEIAIGDNTAPTSSLHHLLVYYSDKKHRDAFANKIVRQKNRDYVDLGYIKGEAGRDPILGQVSSLDDLYDSQTGKAIPPEVLGHNSDYRGWLVTYDDGDPMGNAVYAYNYLKAEPTQDFVGRIGGGNGTSFIISDTEPQEGGPGAVWGKTEDIMCF